MKKKFFFATALFVTAMALSSCTPQKQVVYQPAPQQPSVQNNNSLGQEIDVPCVYESMDNEEYFKELGTATSINMQSARTAALQAAKDMIFQKLGGYVKGLSESYSRTVAGQATQEKVQRLMEADMNQVVQQYVNNAQKTCEKMYDKGANGYTSFIAIQIPVKKMVDKMVDVLSADEELDVQVQREIFREHSDKVQKQILEEQKNNGR